MTALVVAYTQNRVIGKNNDLPWYLPADLKRFKQLTDGHSVIMGRRTFESILSRLGKPLPNRQNIVLTHREMDRSDIVVADTMERALSLSTDEDTFIIGGASVFEEGLEVAERIYATEVDTQVDGDVLFPQFDTTKWRELERQHFTADDKNPYNYDFVTYERIHARGV